MPRLLPRLLKWLESNPPPRPDYRGPLVRRCRRAPRSLWRPTRTADEHNQSFSLQNRHQSLLLDDENILTSPKENARHKSFTPVLKLHENQVGQIIDQDSPREMTEQEKEWWSSPYLRMLSSPVRFCILSYRHLPNDFLIRLVALRANTRGPAAEIVPSGILHPKFARRAFGVVHYVTCWKEAVETMVKTQRYKRLVNVSAHPLLLEQIAHQLRLRVLQELELLVLRLKAAPRTLSDEVVTRRLTRSEWSTVKDTGRIPWEGVACVLVVPPVNKDPHTKERLQPNYSDGPPEPSDGDSVPANRELPPLPPVSTLRPAGESSYEEPLEFLQDTHLPQSRVPVYNGLSLFPSRTQRAALYEKLCEVLDVERRVRWRQKKQSSDASRGENPSHAFIVFSTGRAVTRVDTVPLAIALWRVRMWEGAGWGDCDWLLRQLH